MYESVTNNIESGIIEHCGSKFHYPAEELKVGDKVGIVRRGEIDAQGKIAKIQIIGGDIIIVVSCWGNNIPRKLNEVAKKL